MTSSPSSFPIFSAGCYYSDYTKSVTSRRFQQHLQRAPLCSGSGISFHLFILTYSPAFAKP